MATEKTYKKYQITKRNGEKFMVEGDDIIVDGIGTRVLKDGTIVFTTPEQAEVIDSAMLVTDDPVSKKSK